MKRTSIGISAHLGWASTAVVTLEKNALRVLRTDRIETASDSDREALEPYHVAGGFDGLSRVPAPPNAEKVLQRGLKKQQRFTAHSIAKLADQLADRDCKLVRAGMLVSRGRPAPNFAKAVGSHPQIHIQEGLAVRESIASALLAVGAQVRAIDQKDLMTIAATELESLEPAWSDQLEAASPDNGGPWRREEKHAAVAAWLTLKRIS
jgi:hypothetical protein